MTVLLLLLAHLIADFWLQTDKMVKNKQKHLKKHLLHHLLTTGLALAIIWGGITSLRTLPTIFFSHYFLSVSPIF